MVINQPRQAGRTWLRMAMKAYDEACRTGAMPRKDVAMSSKRTWDVELWAKDKYDDEGEKISTGERLKDRYEVQSVEKPTRESVLFANHELIVAASLTPKEVETRITDPFRG